MRFLLSGSASERQNPQNFERPQSRLFEIVLCAAVKAHRNLDFDGIGNRLIPARDFFLEKKQKRARCSGLPSRVILCRTCRAKAACLGGVSVCIPYAAGAACPSCTVRQIGTRLWPCACAQ